VTFLQIGGSATRFPRWRARHPGRHAGTAFNNFATKRGFNQLMSFNEIMSIPLGGLAVHTQKMKKKPDRDRLK